MPKFQDILKIQQPVVYRVLKKSLQENRLSHAYLLSGDAGTPKKETAFLLAKSLLCEQKGPFGCEECLSCQRVDDLSYADLTYFDVIKDKTGVEDIRNLLSGLQKTAVEPENHKIYILDNADALNPSSANALLKCLEEPSGNTTTAILITQKPEQILPTIRSRCQIIRFHSLSEEDCYKECLKREIKESDAKILSHLYRDMTKIVEICEDSSYQDAIELFERFLKDMSTDWNLALANFENDELVRGNKTMASNKNLREIIRYFMDLLAMFFTDISVDFYPELEYYKEAERRMKDTVYNSTSVLEILYDAQNKLTAGTSFNAVLVLEKAVYEIQEVAR